MQLGDLNSSGSEWAAGGIVVTSCVFLALTASGRARSLRCSSSPMPIRFAGFGMGSRAPASDAAEVKSPLSRGFNAAIRMELPHHVICDMIRK